MSRAQPQRQHRPAEVVPVDDQARAANAGDGERDRERRDGGWVLHQDRAARLDDRGERREQGRSGTDGVPRCDQQEDGAGQRVPAGDRWRPEHVDRDATVGRDLRGQLGLLVPDELHVRAAVGQRACVVQHAWAATQIPQHHHGHAEARHGEGRSHSPPAADAPRAPDRHRRRRHGRPRSASARRGRGVPGRAARRRHPLPRHAGRSRAPPGTGARLPARHADGGAVLRRRDGGTAAQRDRVGIGYGPGAARAARRGQRARPRLRQLRLRGRAPGRPDDGPGAR